MLIYPINFIFASHLWFENEMEIVFGLKCDWNENTSYGVNVVCVIVVSSTDG